MSKKPHDSDIAFIEALASLLRDNDLSEIEVNREYGEADSLTVRVSRQSAVVAAPPALSVPSVPAPAASQVAAAAPAATPDAAPDPSEDPGVVTSPMVGTAYMQTEPGAPEFIRVGDSVAEGQTIIIIEAMKTMNQIPSPRDGKVKRILVEDGAPIEFGAPLIGLE